MYNKISTINIENIDDNSINLILIDPPYIILKNTRMNEHYNKVKHNEEKNKNEKTEED